MDIIEQIMEEYKRYLIGDNENPGLLEENKYHAQHMFDLIYGEEEYNGAFGEWLTEYKIEKNVTGYYKMFKNVYVPYQTKNSEETKTTEIDIVVVHETGLYIIESKNLSGWIFGSENQKTWTQCLANKEHRQFYNPILQNRTHINILSKHIKISSHRMKSFIVFSERCELKKVPNSTEKFIIVKRENFTKAITSEISKRETMFTKKQVDFISSKIAKLTDVSDEVKEQHIENIKK